MVAGHRRGRADDVLGKVIAADSVFAAADHLARVTGWRRRRVLRSLADDPAGIPSGSPAGLVVEALHAAGDLAAALSEFVDADPVDFFFGPADRPIRHSGEITEDALLPSAAILSRSVAQWTGLAGARAWPAVPARLRSAAHDAAGGLAWQLYEMSGDPADLLLALTEHLNAVSTGPEDDPLYPEYLARYGVVCRHSAPIRGDDSGLDVAIACHKLAAELTPADSPERARFLNYFGNSLLQSGQSRGRIGELQTAAEVFQEAAEAAGDVGVRATSLMNRALALAAAAVDADQVEAALELLDQAIPDMPAEVQQRAVESRARLHALLANEEPPPGRSVNQALFDELETGVELDERHPPLVRFLEAPTWPAVLRVLTTQPSMLDDAALNQIDELVAAASGAGDEGSATYFRQRREVLATAVADGFSAAEQRFAALFKKGGDGLEDLIDAFLDLVPAPDADPEPSAEQVRDAAKLAELVRGHPRLSEVADPVMASFRSGYGTLLLSRTLHTPDEAQLSAARAEFEAALVLLPAASPLRCHVLVNLAAVEQLAYRATQDRRHLSDAVALAESAVAAAPPGPPAGLALVALVDALQSRHEAAGDDRDRERVVALLREAAPDGVVSFTPFPPAVLRRLLAVLATMYTAEPDVDVLEFMAAAAEAMVASIADAGLADAVRNAIRLRVAHGYIVGSVAEVRWAVETTEETLAQAAVPERPQLVVVYGDAAADLTRMTGEVASLNRAIDELVAVAAQPGTAPQVAHEARSSAIACLRLRHMRAPSRADLDLALALATESADRPGTAELLASVEVDLYHATGDLSLLRRAVARYDDLLPVSDQTLLATAAAAFTELSSLDGDLRRSEQALELARQAVSVPVGSPYERARAYNALINALTNGRWSPGTETAAELEVAVRRLRDLLEGLLAGSPDRGGLLTTLALGARTLGGFRNDIRAYEQACTALAEALAIMPVDHPQRHIPALNLAADLLAIGRLRRSPAPSAEAVTLLRATRAATPRSTPASAALAHNLAEALRDQWEFQSRSETEREADDMYREACTEGLLVAPENTLVAAGAWAAWSTARGRRDQAAEAYDIGLSAAELLFRTQGSRAHKVTWISRTQHLPEAAALAMITAGRAWDAALALERGRALLLSEALALFAIDLSALRSDHPGLADEYTAAAAALHARLYPPAAAMSPPEPVAAAWTRLNAAIAEIRRTDGNADFLRPPSTDDIVAAAVQQPLIYVLPGDDVGAALVIRPGAIEPQHIPLPGLGKAVLDEKAGAFLAAYQGIDWDPPGWRSTLGALCDWMWTAVMGPLIDHLGGVPAATVVACGRLGILPLHAARTPDPGRPTGYRYALDEMAIAYSPNARTHDRATRYADSHLVASALVVHQPEPTVLAPLRHAGPEVDGLATRLPRVHLLTGTDATRDAVIGVLAAHDVVHFCCHGRSDARQPLSGGLFLAGDELLTVRDLLGSRLPGVRLAVLSACETAVLDRKLPNETVSIATGLRQAGAAGVVATQWPILDEAAPAIMTEFYRRWLDDGVAPVLALRAAQQTIRDQAGADDRLAHPDAWAAFALTGT